MSDIGHLPPAWRVPPGLPGKGVGQEDRAPQRKPEKEQQRQKPRRKRGPDDDAPIIDEYA